jgi:predicted house-cleaning noncanonical NTP pyrophosphatase (MazG superfamily)
VEELADLLEVIHALAKHHGSSIQEVEAARADKVRKRGDLKRRSF